MSRKSSRKNKKPEYQSKKIIMPPVVIESDNFEDRSPTSTLGGLGPDMKSGLNRDGTIAPKIGENEDEKEEKYAQSPAELFDKHFFSKKGLSCTLFILILCIMGYIFIQDNGARALNNWKDIEWSILKCSFFLILYAVFILYQLISGWWKKRNR